MSDRPRRVMWLLNHGAARRFEVPMLKRWGYNEVFLPKSFPGYGFRSASVDWSEDPNLSIPPEDLALMNATDWYGEVPKEVWDIANRHFDVMFFLLHFSEFVQDASRNFKGVMVWRVYGRQIEMNYDQTLRSITRDRGPAWLKSMGERFVFGMAYEHLHLVEPDYLSRRALYLPLGMDDCRIQDEWEGGDKRLLFVCPDIESSYYGKVYKDFYRDFGDLPHAVGGVQPIVSDRPNVLGFLPQAEYDRNMRQFRVMYYHSVEPNHVHYHPFEAVKVGMPLVFRANGLLDRLGGKDLPGRATSAAQARRLIERLQGGDNELARHIRDTQGALLREMEPERCAPFWKTGLARIDTLVERTRARPTPSRALRKVAVLLPVAYRGGTLGAIKLVAEAIHRGSQQAGEPAQVVLGYPEDGGYEESDFSGLPEGVQKRPFSWRVVTREQSRRIMTLAGDADWTPESGAYQVPDDGISSFYDCDLWLLISDRALNPLLPIRPVATLVYDYVQRYFDLWGETAKVYKFLQVGWLGDKVLTTTEFTTRDAIQFGSVPTNRVAKLPMMGRRLAGGRERQKGLESPYFLWPTNTAPHKNQVNAARALAAYYEEFQGKLQCIVSGTNTERLLDGGWPHLDAAGPKLRELVDAGHLRIGGSMGDYTFARTVADAAFVWHPAIVDNGTFSVVEAAYLGVPSLSSDYPAMREMDQTFGLQLSWTVNDDPRKMASALKWMEGNAEAVRGLLPSAKELDVHSPESVGLAYWKELAKLA